MKTVQELLSQLAAKGYKQTSTRKNILKLFYSHKHPISVPEIQSYLQNNCQINPNKTTIYREITFLIEQNIIKEVQIIGNVKRYELTDLQHHHHLICTTCKKILDFEPSQEVEEAIRASEQKVASKHSFTPKEHVFELYGLCHECSNKDTP